MGEIPEAARPRCAVFRGGRGYCRYVVLGDGSSLERAGWRIRGGCYAAVEAGSLRVGCRRWGHRCHGETDMEVLGMNEVRDVTATQDTQQDAMVLTVVLDA